MKKFKNNKILTLKDLRESGEYSEELLNAIEIGDYNQILRLVTPLNRAKIDFMEPLLYAVKNDKNTFKIYEYYDETIQASIDKELSAQIVINEPELFYKTPKSANKDFIRESVRLNPKIIKYADNQLKTDDAFVQELSIIDNAQIREEIASNCNVELAIINNQDLRSDVAFIGAAILVDVNNIKYASEELRDDKEFLKEQSLKNESLIKYATENVDKFGAEGIKGIEQASRENAFENSINIIDEMAEKGEDKRYSMVKERIHQKGKDDQATMRTVTAMVAQKDEVSPEFVERVLNYSILTMETLKRDKTENGEMNINLENMLQLITPTIINRIIDKGKLQGFEIDSNVQKKLDTYLEFYQEYHEKFNEQKRKKLEEKNIDVKKIKEGVSGELNNPRETDEALIFVERDKRSLQSREI